MAGISAPVLSLNLVVWLAMVRVWMWLDNRARREENEAPLRANMDICSGTPEETRGEQEGRGEERRSNRSCT